nr:uncharacterized protein LOC112285168 isoform X1 [Physcomitrium patens]|eukprot:XP_024381544.1 uncharacterized protein LOC112285168 isoform X1 [Physcomitrella patens]
MAYSLFIIAFLEKDGVRKLEALEEVAEIVFRFHIAPFITDDNIGIRSSTLFKLWKKQRNIEDYANRGRWGKAMRETDNMLELIQNLSSPRDKNVEELAVRIARCSFYSSWGNRKHALEEVEKVIAAVNSVEYPDVRESVRLAFVHCLCSHAVDCHKDGNVTESKRLMGLAKSKISRCNNALELAEVEFSEARMLCHEGQWVEAADKARASIFLLMKEQRRLCHLDHEPISWLSYSRDYLNEKLVFIESLYIRRLQNPIIGLVWAERSQQRFLMHQFFNQPKEIAIPSPSDLDECDQLLTTLFFQTTKALRLKTSIIEYSYNLDKEIMNMYVVAMSPDGKDFLHRSKICHLPTWFEETNLSSNQSLQELIVDAIDEQGRSIEALSILHALLIQYIEEDLKGCDSLIYVPGHGCLAKIPFAALYDDRHKEHLIAEYNVAVVPSIVTLHRCLYSQYNFERDLQVLGQNLLQDSSLEPGSSEQPLKFDGHLPSNVAFIAGNQEPMGLGWNQLRGAEEEAKRVAAFFKVTPCIGKDMTKQAVIEGLSTSKVVLLATHGVVNDDYPHGCLVLQACPGPNEVTSTSPLQPELDVIVLNKRLCRPDEVASTSTSTLPPGMDMLTLSKQLNDVALASTATLEVSSTPVTTAELWKGKGIAEEQEQDVLQHDGHQEGKRSLRLFEFSDKKSKQQRAGEASQVLTAEEIGALKGGISAGLVVLSACQSGLGEAITGEGLLGLGRALLLAGAVSTILTLWKVDDVFTGRFIIDLFKEMLIAEPRGRSVDECMKDVILNMIRERQPLKHWAAFTIVGSPALRLFKPDNSTWGASGLDKHSYHAFQNYNTCPYSCRVCEKRGKRLATANALYQFTMFPIQLIWRAYAPSVQKS